MPPTHRRRGRADSFAVGCLALALYAWLGQRTLYGDGPTFLLGLHEGWTDHFNHAAYLPLLDLLRAIAAPLGITTYEAARGASALGAAIGVGCLHRASRLCGLSRGDSALVALLAASSPSLVFFATVVEVQAPFFACVGLATVATAALIRAPGHRRAALLGAATGLAYLMHASALVLPATLLAVFIARVWPHASAPPARPRVLGLAATALAAHVLLVGALTAALRLAGRSGNPLSAWHHLLDWGKQALQHPECLLTVAWTEWLWPYLPLSVAWLVALRYRACRPLAAALGASLLAYLLLSYLLLGAAANEHGAYLHPLLWPAAWLCVAALRRRIALALLAALLALSFATVRSHDDPRAPAEYARGFHAITDGRPAFLLIGSLRDLEACFVALPATPFWFLPTTPFMQPQLVPTAIRRLDRFLRQKWGEGVAVYLTGDLQDMLGSAFFQSYHPGLRRTLELLHAGYALVPVAAFGFRGSRIEPPGTSTPPPPGTAVVSGPDPQAAAPPARPPAPRR